MKIVTVADLHYNEEARPRAEALAHAACASEADVLVLAGDCAADGPEFIPDVLSLFADFDGPRLMVPGNHDLWQHEGPFETARLLEETLPEIAAAHGFHCLDRAPFVVGDTAFVGSMGWYDFSFRQTEPPLAGLTVTPIAVSPGHDGQMAFEAVPGSREMRWEELGPDDYVPGGLIWQTEGPPHVTVWMDAVRLDWGRGAPEVTAKLAARLHQQVVSVASQARRVVEIGRASCRERV